MRMRDLAVARQHAHLKGSRRDALLSTFHGFRVSALQRKDCSPKHAPICRCLSRIFSEHADWNSPSAGRFPDWEGPPEFLCGDFMRKEQALLPASAFEGTVCRSEAALASVYRSEVLGSPRQS